MTREKCGGCEAKDDVIVAMQHVIREMRHELGNLGFEERLNTAQDAERKTA